MGNGYNFNWNNPKLIFFTLRSIIDRFTNVHIEMNCFSISIRSTNFLFLYHVQYNYPTYDIHNIFKNDSCVNMCDQLLVNYVCRAFLPCPVDSFYKRFLTEKNISESHPPPSWNYTFSNPSLSFLIDINCLCLKLYILNANDVNLRYNKTIMQLFQHKSQKPSTFEIHRLFTMRLSLIALHSAFTVSSHSLVFTVYKVFSVGSMCNHETFT